MATDYAIGYLMFAGAPLTEASEIDFEEMSNDKPIDTILKGRAGYTSGPEECKITIKSAVPRAGYEVNFAAICRSHQTIQVRFRLSNTERTAEGRIMTVKSMTSVNGSTYDIMIDGKVIAEAAV